MLEVGTVNNVFVIYYVKIFIKFFRDFSDRNIIRIWQKRLKFVKKLKNVKV